ncbi:MAG TPA: SDR family NAD(P)-dependent oxidoreductase, partial [Solirubrobacterales bacterium]|nr:SDR family NAD(P)-dependent oxidoreductase [Solirubrobacterales bacterium]
MPGRLEGKVCVITGTASGIGAATARLFAAEGAKVAGIDLDAEQAVGALTIAADVADEQQVRAALAEAHEAFGRIDVLINNAGINPVDDGSVLETSLETWQRVQDVNLRSVFLCCK